MTETDPIATRMLIMRPDEPHETRTVSLPHEPSYDALAKLIRPLLDGGELEHVAVLADFTGGTSFQRSDMFVDESGLLKGLPRNEAATLIYRRNTLLRKPATVPESLPFIVGTAVLFDRRVW